MGIQVYFVIALVLAGIVLGGFVLWFVSGSVWSHRWQEREHRD